MSVAHPRVLVVSESRITRRVVEMTFADQPLHVVTAASSAQALDEFRAQPSRVVIADIAMQPPDGYSLARAIRSAAAGEDTVVILLAAQAAAVDEGAVVEHRVSSVLRKPLDSQQLLDALRQGLRAGARNDVSSAAEGADPPLASAECMPSDGTFSNDGGRLAQAFHALLDVEQGLRPAFALELTDDEVDRIASRVAAILAADADRAARIDGVVHDCAEAIVTGTAAAAAERMVPTVAADVVERIAREMAPRLVEQVARPVVADVSERLVREEIARLRATRRSA